MFSANLYLTNINNNKLHVMRSLDYEYKMSIMWCKTHRFYINFHARYFLEIYQQEQVTTLPTSPVL